MKYFSNIYLILFYTKFYLFKYIFQKNLIDYKIKTLVKIIKKYLLDINLIFLDYINFFYLKNPRNITIEKSI